MIQNKNFGFWNKMYSLFHIMAEASQYGKNLSHYTISISNSKGNILIYDSETDTIIDGDSEEEEQHEAGKKEEEKKAKEKEKEKEQEKEDEKEDEKRMKNLIQIQLDQMIHLISLVVDIYSS